MCGFKSILYHQRDVRRKYIQRVRKMKVPTELAEVLHIFCSAKVYTASSYSQYPATIAALDSTELQNLG